MAGALHVASDVDRLYVQKTKGGRGLKSIEVGIMKHLEEVAENHRLLRLVKQHEKEIDMPAR